MVLFGTFIQDRLVQPVYEWLLIPPAGYLIYTQISRGQYVVEAWLIFVRMTSHWPVELLLVPWE